MYENIAITSFWIALKLEEPPAVVYPFRCASKIQQSFIEDLSAKDICKLERLILNKLDFSPYHTPVVDFVEYYMYQFFNGSANINSRSYNIKLSIAYYLCELASVDYQYYQYYGNRLAAAALYISMVICNDSSNGVRKLAKDVHEDCRRFLLNCLFNPPLYIYKKYLKEEYFKVAFYLAKWLSKSKRDCFHLPPYFVFDHQNVKIIRNKFV